MKVLGVAFSARKEGNCLKLLKFCLGELAKQSCQTDLLNGFDLSITPCSRCKHDCFNGLECPLDDDVPELYAKCQKAEALIFAVPTYGGHLASLFFAFAERSAGGYIDFAGYEENFLKKVNFIIIGNLSSGGDLALHEALHEFANRRFWPETLLLSSREYRQSSLDGNLAADRDVQNRLKRFVESIMKKYNISAHK